VLTVVAITALATASTGCATRRYVRNRTEPINQQVGELDKRSTDNARKIGELDDKTSREISRVGEKASAADARANDAARTAGDALTKGGQAMEQAQGARSMAENNMARTGQLEKYIDSYDNFQMSSSKTILFGFDKATLTDDAKKDLDDLAQSLSNAKKYVIEVQGFTDTTGPSNYNYGLSERRAATVVRYLTEKHNIPVYRVHTIGLGKDMPAQGAKGREGRKLSRRVEVKVYMRPDLPQTAQSGSMNQPSTTPSTTPGTTESTTTPSSEAPRPPDSENGSRP
jgi:outer membrane protein OmpA-like peptidoglycan-associated protein